MSDPKPAIEQLLKDEGSGFIEDDHGRGACKFGITLKTAQETHPDWTNETIEALTEEQAASWYEEYWWDRYHFSLLEDQDLASKVFNISVNVGPGTAIKWLQEIVVGPNPDGILGPVTANKANAADPKVVLSAFNQKAKAHYMSLGPEYADAREGLVKRAEQA
jgi:lysozyme family protein